MKHLLSTTFAALMALSAPVFADSPVVVELFTSQGCSSCPPADKMLHALAKRDDVIALALHVDYWDYIGWKDQFAQAKFTKRQRNYAALGNRRSIYTPQMIVMQMAQRVHLLCRSSGMHRASRSVSPVVRTQAKH